MSHFSHKVKCICTQPQRANNLENYFSLQSQQNVSTSSVQLEIEIFHPVFLAEQFKLSPSLMENIRIRIFKYWFLILGSTMFYIETKCSGRCEVLVFYHKAFCFYNRQQRKSYFSLILTFSTCFAGYSTCLTDFFQIQIFCHFSTKINFVACTSTNSCSMTDSWAVLGNSSIYVTNEDK